MPQHKACRECKKDLPLNSFHKDKTKPGGINPVCRVCIRERRVRLGYARPIEEKKYIRTKLNGNAKPFDLGVLLTLQKRADNRSWTVVEAKKLLNVYVRLRQKKIKLDDALKQANIEGKTMSSAKLLMYELIKAAKAGMTLEDYFEKGRPFKTQYKNETLVAARK